MQWDAVLTSANEQRPQRKLLQMENVYYVHEDVLKHWLLAYNKRNN